MKTTALLLSALWALSGWIPAAEAQSQSPVQVISKSGSVTIRNVSSKAIVACEGRLSYEVAGVHRTTLWRQFFLPAEVMGRTFEPGQELTFPPTYAPNDMSQTLTYRDATVTGVVFDDGSVWGETGRSLRAALGSKMAELSAKLRRVLVVAESTSPDALEAALQGPGPLISGEQQWQLVHAVVKKALLDEQGKLRGDAHVRLRQMITSLDEFARQLEVSVR